MRWLRQLLAALAVVLLPVAAAAFQPIELEPEPASPWARLRRFAIQLTAHGHNLHLLDEGDNGFALYRSAMPTRQQFEAICRLGIQEVVVLSGNAQRYEARYRESLCPDLQVVYNREQDQAVPLNADFLRQFDRWIARARAEGRKVLFRCDCGCHRTGRLAAYYRMKYHGISAQQAIDEMNRRGFRMRSRRYRTLPSQVRALEEHIRGVECTQEESACVREDG